MQDLLTLDKGVYNKGADGHHLTPAMHDITLVNNLVRLGKHNTAR